MSSIKDVAALAGVSLSTVSIVVNGKAKERKISEATQQRVLEAMQELSYIPNVSAKSLRKGDTQKYVVALFWNFDFRGIMMHRFLFGLQKRIQEENADMSVVIHPYQTGKLSKEAESFQNGEFHAAIISNADNVDLEFLEKSDFKSRIVLYNRLSDRYSSVNVDNEKIGQLAAEHLCHAGYRRPIVVSASNNFQEANSREIAFMDRMERLGANFPEHRMVYAKNSVKGGFECGQRILQEKLAEDADCFFCASDAIGLGMMNAWYEKGGIPDQMGLIAIGNSDPQYAKYHRPSISVINIPIEEMAEGCYELLKEGMHSPEQKVERRYFETQLYQRESTGKSAQSSR